MSTCCSAVRAATNAARSSSSSIAAILLAYTAFTDASADIGPIVAVGSASVARGSKPGAHMA